MLDNRTGSLIRVAVLSSRPQFRNLLFEELRKIKSAAFASREELYEICIQSYLFAGFPAALESVRALSKVFGDGVYINNPKAQVISEYEQHYINGEKLYQEVYAANAVR